MNDLFYCKDCDCLVDENHRCQQWSTVSRIPSGAIKHLSKIIAKLKQNTKDIPKESEKEINHNWKVCFATSDKPRTLWDIQGKNND